MDYGQFRERLKRATELCKKINNTSKKLAELLRDAADIGFSGWPSEFFSISELLWKTDNHEMQNHNLYMWRRMRGHVLGDPPRRDLPEKEQSQEENESANSSEIVITFTEPDEKPEIDPEEETRSALRYAWGVAPDLSELLDTVEKAAGDFKPSESGMIGAAIKFRQRSVKTEYLRAFVALLTNSHHFILDSSYQFPEETTVITKAVKQAMAIVANVAINLPDIDASYDDVRQALKRLSGD
jgi:hypothetical protein